MRYSTLDSGIGICLVFFLILSLALTPVANASLPSPASDRTGAWVDTVIFSEQPGFSEAVTALEGDQLDIYAQSSQTPADYLAIRTNPKLAYATHYTIYLDLTLNPAELSDGRLNPFANPGIRSALNRLIDRTEIVETILAGLGIPKLLLVTPGFPEYLRHQDKAQELEDLYAYDFTGAQQAIATEMQAMGATMPTTTGKWEYDGEPVTLIFLMRIEDERQEIGDYIADQLENAGFTIDRRYYTSSQASALWVNSNPADGLWHLYTGGWVETGLERNQGYDFEFFYSPTSSYNFSPLWQAYSPTPEFSAAMIRLSGNDFADMGERGQVFNQALEYSLEDAVRLWLVEREGFTVRQQNTTYAPDIAGNSLSKFWPYTVRFTNQEGGVMRMALPALLVNPLNPIGGSAWMFDQIPLQATQDYDVLAAPASGLNQPQRIESAEVLVRSGVLMTKTLDWVTLEFTPTINVPANAWVDWDATAQEFITAGEKYTQTLTANVRTTVHYPADLFSTVTWHDGSPLSAADFVMRMIMTFDPAKPESAIYDPAQEGNLTSFMNSFRGVRIVSTAPLVIETYSDDTWILDAEQHITPWWPNYPRGTAAWHNLAVGVRAEAAGDLAFTEAKATDLQVTWMNFTSGDSLPILLGYLNQSATETYIPYLPTLGDYISAPEAAARWSNLQAWYTAHGHFWLGPGPFYLEGVDSGNRTITLQRYASFPDPAGRWDVNSAVWSELYLPLAGK